MFKIKFCSEHVQNLRHKSTYTFGIENRIFHVQYRKKFRRPQMFINFRTVHWNLMNFRTSTIWSEANWKFCVIVSVKIYEKFGRIVLKMMGRQFDLKVLTVTNWLVVQLNWKWMKSSLIWEVIIWSCTKFEFKCQKNRIRQKLWHTKFKFWNRCKFELNRNIK